jgi:hypothetical protein
MCHYGFRKKAVNDAAEHEAKRIFFSGISGQSGAPTLYESYAIIRLFYLNVSGSLEISPEMHHCSSH